MASGSFNMVNMELSFVFLLVIFSLLPINGDDKIKTKISNSTVKTPTTESPIGCVCGIFLSGQFKKGNREQPTGNPALVHDQPGSFPCTPAGNRLCVNKCLDTIIKYLPNSSTILCSSLERDCYKERAYLFTKNCKNEWINSNLSAGREYCCKNGAPYKCPIFR